MKRYRVLLFDFDSTATWLSMEINEDWSDEVKENHRESYRKTREAFARQYGESHLDAKIENLRTIGNLPMSIMVGHNQLFRQARGAFVAGAYYPALTGVCALGERVLNTLVLKLRDEYVTSKSYKSVHRKRSIDNWKLMIDALDEWQILLPEVSDAFRELSNIRNYSIHYNLDLVEQDRALALDAFDKMHTIISRQFAALGNQPWFIPEVRGAGYIAKDWENNPFVRHLYLPCSAPLGPYHKLIPDLETGIWEISDDHEYEDSEVSDSEFVELLERRLSASQSD